MPSFEGTSQASALTSTTILGGKSSRAPGSALIGQPSQALFEKPFAPLAYDLPRQIEPGANFIIGESSRGQKHYLGTYDRKVRCRILLRQCFKFCLLVLG
ncbi:MAG: hypothetical protein ABSG91_22370 [Syntrophobacteraceae bacterium]